MYFGTSVANLGGITAGKQYFASGWVRSSKSVQTRAPIEWKDSSSILSTVSGSYVNVGNNWARLVVSCIAPAGSVRATVTLYVNGSPWVSGDYQDLDPAMMYEGDVQYNYASGESPNWVWLGAKNNSILTGPGL